MRHPPSRVFTADNVEVRPDRVTTSHAQVAPLRLYGSSRCLRAGENLVGNYRDTIGDRQRRCVIRPVSAVGDETDRLLMAETCTPACSLMGARNLDPSYPLIFWGPRFAIELLPLGQSINETLPALPVRGKKC